MFYSAAFDPAAAYLRWTLLGDYLKVTSWILSIPILAARDMKMFLAADLAAYGVFERWPWTRSRYDGGFRRGDRFCGDVHDSYLLCAIYLWRVGLYSSARRWWPGWRARRRDGGLGAGLGPDVRISVAIALPPACSLPSPPSRSGASPLRTTRARLELLSYPSHRRRWRGAEESRMLRSRPG